MTEDGSEDGQVPEPPSLPTLAVPAPTAKKARADLAALGIGPRRRGELRTCPTCHFSFVSREGWRLEVSGDDSTEVERVALALTQSVSTQQGTREGLLEVVQGDKYVLSGVNGPVAVGPQAAVVIQDWNEFVADVDVAALVRELAVLRAHLDSNALEEAVVAGAIASAEVAAGEADGPAVLAWLRKAGKAALELAREIGTDVAAAALKRAMGLA